MERTIAAHPRALDPSSASRDGTASELAAASPRLLWQQRGLLVALTLLVMLPFLGKPVHIDDPLFVWTAQQIQIKPLDFYGFEVNWFGYSAPMSDMTKNPPLAAYYMAAAALALGFGEVGLHTAQLLPTLAAVLGTFELARLMCGRPLLATLVALGTPVFVVCATSLMSDVPFLALWVWSLVFWHRGLQERRESLLFTGAVLATFAALTKYFGMCLIPLMLVDAIAVRRAATWSLLWLLIPIATMFAYERATASMYGYGLISDARIYASRANATEGAPRNLEGVFRLLVYLGGCVVGVLFFAPRCWQRGTLILGVLAALVLAITGLYRGWADVLQEVTNLATGEGWRLLAHVFVFALAGLAVLAFVASDFTSRRGNSAPLLGAWMIGTLLFAGFVNWTINGRTILPVVPALGILVARRLDETEAALTHKKWLGEVGAWDVPPLVIGLAAAMAAAAGDYAHAVSARDAAHLIAQEHRPTDKKFTFVGHWGFQYYFVQQGAIPLDSSHMTYDVGDIVVVPRWNTNTVLIPTELADMLTLVEMESPWPVVAQRKRVNAGFYGSSYGRLPWRLGPLPPDDYVVQRVKRPFRLNIPPPAIR